MEDLDLKEVISYLNEQKEEKKVKRVENKH